REGVEHDADGAEEVREPEVRDERADRDGADHCREYDSHGRRRNGLASAYIVERMAALYRMFFACDHCRWGSTQTIRDSTRPATPQCSATLRRVLRQMSFCIRSPRTGVIIAISQNGSLARVS